MSQEQTNALTPVTTADLFAALQPAWRALLGEDAPRAALVLLVAQFCLEDAWGHACHNFNLGNVKARAGGATDWTYFGCDEVLTPAQATADVAADPAHCHVEHQDAQSVVVWFDPPHPACCFASYPDLATGAAAWLALQHGRFAHAWAPLLAGNAVAFAMALHQAGYFTAPASRYATTLASIQATIDKQLPALPPPDTGDPLPANGVQTDTKVA